MANDGSQDFRRLDHDLPVSQLDTFKDVICIINKQGIITYVNRAVLPVWGYHTEEMIGKSTLNFIKEDDRVRCQRAIAEFGKEKDASFFINRILKKDGSVSEVEWHNTWDEDKQLLFGIAKDVTSEKELSESRKRNSDKDLAKYYGTIPEILERIADGFYCLDVDSTVTYWSHKSEELTGISREEILGRNLWDIFHVGVGGYIYQQHEKAMKEHVSQEYETYSEPLCRWFRINTYPSPYGISVFFKDITKQKTVEKEVEKLSLIVKETTNAVILTDALNRITWVNDAFTQMTGFAFEEAIGHTRFNLLQGAKTDKKAAQYIHEQLSAGEGFHTEILCYKKNGTTYWSNIMCQPIYNEEGNLREFFSIETDITEKKVHQKQITAATIKAQEKERSQVAQELHDNVNQVLTTVKLYLELCIDGIPNAKEILDRSVILLLKSINEIRTLSKRLSDPTIGKIKLKDSIADLIDSVGFTNTPHITLDSSIENVRVNKELHLAIYRILQEHLTNILKHAEAKDVQITVSIENRELCLIVADDGKGFDVYEKRKGIGITNMKSRAESLNGTFNINSSPGKGSTLSVSFPLDH